MTPDTFSVDEKPSIEENETTVSGLLLSPGCCDTCYQLHSKNLGFKFMFHVC